MNVSRDCTMLAFLFFSISDQVFLSRERETSMCSDFFFFLEGVARFFGWRSDVFCIFKIVFSPAKLLSYFCLEFWCFLRCGGVCVVFLIYFFLTICSVTVKGVGSRTCKEFRGFVNHSSFYLK